MRNDRLRLEDVRDSIEQIEKYSSQGRQLSMTTNLSGCGFSITSELSARRVAVSLMPFVSLTRMRFGPTPLASETCWFTNTLASTMRRFGQVVERDLPVLKQKVLYALEG